MSKLPEERKNVFSFLEASLKNQEESTSYMKTMLYEMRSALDEVKETRDQVVDVQQEVDGVKLEMVDLAKQIKDENRLLPSEVDDLFNAVVIKSIQLAKTYHEKEEEEFKKIVGKYRRLVWRKINKHFGTSKYIHIKRKDFQSALDYIRDFDLEREFV